MICLASLQTEGQLIQQGPKLVGSGAVGAPSQSAVAISADGNTAIVGGGGDNGGTGAAWIFIRTGGVWTQQGPKLVGTGAVVPSGQGSAVAISADGNTAVVGGGSDNSLIGAAWVFTRSGGVWTQQGPKLVGTGASNFALQGRSVAISGDGNTILLGGPLDGVNSGAAWVFTRSAGVWSQQGGKLVSSSTIGAAAQGSSVALSNDGNTAIVGGPNDTASVGGAWIFTRSGGVWTQEGGTLSGNDRTVVVSVDQGLSVAMSADGNTVAIGGPGDGANDGAAWIFTRSGGVWTQQGNKIVGTGGSNFALQGSSVALSSDGDTLVSGGRTDTSGTGAAWVFRRSGGVWTQQGSKLVGSGAVGPLTANQGTSVAAASGGSTVIVGGPRDDNQVGADWVFANAADLAIAQSASQGTVGTGLPYDYTVTVSNAGSAAAANVTVTDTLPAGAVFVGASGSGWSCGQAAGVVTCTMPSLGIAAAAPITVSVLAQSTPGNAINGAIVASDAVDPTPSNNSSTSTVAVVPAGQIPALSAWLLALLAMLFASIGLRMAK